jgi:hypothetical protein
MLSDPPPPVKSGARVRLNPIAARQTLPVRFHAWRPPLVTSSRLSTVVKLLSFSFLLLAGSLNCQASAPQAAQTMRVGSQHELVSREFSQVFQSERTVTLQDGNRVTTVLPVLTVEPGARFFVVDPREQGIRRYDSLGNLLLAFGRRGGGPGEFTRLVGAASLSSGEIVAVDATGRVTFFDATGNQTRTAQSGLGLIYNIALVNDSTLALAGRALDGGDGPFVHIWDLTRQRITTSFFEMPPHDRDLDAAYAFSGAVDVAVRGDTVATTIALSDTVYLFTTGGRALEKLPMPSRHFRHVRRSPPQNLQQDADARLEWSRSFSRMSKVFWAPDGSLYVQYFDIRDSDPQWSFVHMRRGREPAVEVHDNPRLLAVSPFDARLYFIHPESQVPNVWVIGRSSSGH